jgi:hypothetical protein
LTWDGGASYLGCGAQSRDEEGTTMARRRSVPPPAAASFAGARAVGPRPFHVAWLARSHAGVSKQLGTCAGACMCALFAEAAGGSQGLARALAHLPAPGRATRRWGSLLRSWSATRLAPGSRRQDPSAGRRAPTKRTRTARCKRHAQPAHSRQGFLLPAPPMSAPPTRTHRLKDAVQSLVVDVEQEQGAALLQRLHLTQVALRQPAEPPPKVLRQRFVAARAQGRRT